MKPNASSLPVDSDIRPLYRFCINHGRGSTLAIPIILRSKFQCGSPLGLFIVR